MAAHFQATEHKFSSPLTGTCLTWHANWACWRHADVMMTSSLSGSGTWVGSSGIRVGSAHPGGEDTWRASVRVASHPAGACGRFRRQISTQFSTVASSLPPLHSGMVKTQFWQLLFLSKIKHPFKSCALIPIVGVIQPGVYWYLLKRRVSTLRHNI
jgi:hypothetical protein